MKKNLVTQKAQKITHWGGAETPEPIATKFCTSGAVHDIIKHATFGEDRSRGFWVASGRILAFSIDLLPCECAITYRAVVSR